MSTAVLEAYARLKALRDNLPEYEVSAPFVTEFHQIVELLERAGQFNLSSFRVPASEVKPIVVSSNYLDGSVDYSKESFCDRHYFLMKVDGVLNMFQVLLTPTSAPKPSIGFKPQGD